MIYAYVRVSSQIQNEANQHYEIEQFAEKNGLKIDEWIEETISSGKDLKKRKFNSLLKKLNKDDILITTELSRIGRKSFEIMGILYECLNKGCQVWTTKEKYKLGDDLNSQILAFAFSISASIEKSLISARTKETLARLKNSGVKLGRPRGSKNKNLKLAGKEKEIQELLAQGVSKAKISKIYGVNRISLYHFIKKYLNIKKP